MCQFYEIKPKDFKKYQNDGVIRINKVFSKSEIKKLKKKLIYILKIMLNFLRARKLTLYKMK